MTDSNLKKEFNKRDVQRMRNLITGKSGDKTQIQTGWEKSESKKTEGQVWEENGKTWTIKNGIKQNVTKLDHIKNMVYMPLCCPKCNKVMKTNEFNKKMYRIHGFCFDCTIQYEQQLKAEGKFEDYEKNIQKNNQQTYLEDVEKALEAWVNETDSYLSEQGEVQSWVGGDKKKIYDQIKAQLDKIKSEQH